MERTFSYIGHELLEGYVLLSVLKGGSLGAILGLVLIGLFYFYTKIYKWANGKEFNINGFTFFNGFGSGSAMNPTPTVIDSQN